MAKEKLITKEEALKRVYVVQKDHANMDSLPFRFGLHFKKDFQNFQSRPEGENTWIGADPKNPNVPYTKVEFVVTPQFQIRRVQITGQDRSILNFQFGDEKLNPPLSNKLFEFQAPPGAQIAEAAN